MPTSTLEIPVGRCWAADVAEVIGVNTANISGAPGLGLALAIRHSLPRP